MSSQDAGSASSSKKPSEQKVEEMWSAMKAREHRARERMIAVEMLRIMQERINECYRREGVNHYKKCAKLTRKYYDMLEKKDA